MSQNQANVRGGIGLILIADLFTPCVLHLHLFCRAGIWIKGYINKVIQSIERSLDGRKIQVKMKWALRGSFLTVLLLFLTGFAEAADKLTLRMLVWDGYAPVEAQRNFQRLIKGKYNIDLVFQIESATNPDEYFNKIRAGQVDIISPAHNIPKDSRYNLTHNGLTLPVNLENIPNYQKLIPGLAKQHWAMNKGQVYAVPIVHGFYSLAYNSAVIKEPPTSWSILWDPQYKGRYSVNLDYYELNVYITVLALGGRKEDIFHYDSIKGSMLEERLHHLARNAGKFWRGYDRPEHYQDVILATTWRFTFPEKIASLKDWRIAEPREGTPWTIDTIMLSKTLKDNALKKTIAELWINFLLEPENQLSIFANKLGTCPVTVEAWDIYTQSVLSAPERERLSRLFANLIPWQILKTRDRNAFHLLWREALDRRIKHHTLDN